VAVVIVGVMIRSLGAGSHLITTDKESKVAMGVAYTIASAALYSLLGVTYENLITKGTLSHVQVHVLFS
jgi:hypothetical protein